VHYHPTRLVVKQDCLTVTDTVVDATAPPSQHQPDGMRHEPDGDTHGWLQVDPPFASLINAGNTSVMGGNLVFEIVCHYSVTQTVDVSREQKTAVLEFAAESLRASGPSLRDEVLRPVEDDALMKRLQMAPCRSRLPPRQQKSSVDRLYLVPLDEMTEI
jgi:hypothetical protein